MGEPQSAGPVLDNLIPSLRGWQKAAYAEYFRVTKRDFLLVATPGAGKTTYALTIAKELLTRREILAVTIVTPTEHLKYQWAQAAKKFGIKMDEFKKKVQAFGVATKKVGHHIGNPTMKHGHGVKHKIPNGPMGR